MGIAALFMILTTHSLEPDRIGIVGPNGVGKSTLINLIRGKIKPDAGTIDIGETVNHRMLRSRK